METSFDVLHGLSPRLNRHSVNDEFKNDRNQCLFYKNSLSINRLSKLILIHINKFIYLFTKSKLSGLNPMSRDSLFRQIAADLYVLSQTNPRISRKRGALRKSPRFLNPNNVSMKNCKNTENK